MKAIIDCNNLCYMSFYTVGHLSVDEVRTGVIFGFLKQIYNLAKILGTNEFIFSWDSRKSYRRILYPGYKKRNKKGREEVDLKDAFRQFGALYKDILPAMGFGNVFKRVGFESDDIMAEIVLRYSEEGFVLVTTDHDLFQLLEHCDIFNPKKKKYYTEEDFRNEYGISSSKWVDVKSLAGCPTDSVPGIPWIGEKTAIKYLNGELEKGKAYKRIVSTEGRQITQGARKLVVLPYPLVKIKTPLLSPDALDRGKFIEVFDRYKFVTFLEKKMLNNWFERFGI